MKIKDAKGRQDGNSGYARTLGNEDLGQLISRVQATVISNGSELERMIVEKSNTIKNLDKFIEDTTNSRISNGTYLCQKKTLKKSKYNIKGIEPDLVIFIVEKKRICKVIELKDGDAFDTKKATGEKENLEKFTTLFGSKVPFIAEYYICCFNQSDKEKIKIGFKNKFDEAHIMTGVELCNILGINYSQIKKKRENDAKDNFAYFIQELLKIKAVRKEIKKHL